MQSTVRDSDRQVAEDYLGCDNSAKTSYANSENRWLQRSWLLWSERRLLAKALIAGLVFGAIFSFLLKTEFRSSTRLMPPDNTSSSGMALMSALSGTGGGVAGSNAMGGIAADLLGIKSSGEQFVGILHSRTIQDRLVQKLDLRKVYRIKLEEDARARLSEHTEISQDRKSGIITITVTDHNPKLAAAIAQGYVDQLDIMVAGLSTSAARRERVFLEDRLKSVKQDLDQAARSFSEFSSRKSAIDIPEQGKAMVEAAAVLQGQLIAATSELKGLQQIYSDNNVRVRTLRARISELRDQLQTFEGAPSSQDANGPPFPSDGGYPNIRQLPLLGVTYSDLLRRTKIQEAIFETLTKEYELARVQEAKEIPSVKVLDPADVPERRSFPPRLPITLLFGAVGLAGCAFWLIAKRRWDQIDLHAPSKVLAQEVLGSVNSAMPWAAPNGSRFQFMTHKAWLRLSRRPKSEEHLHESSKH